MRIYRVMAGIVCIIITVGCANPRTKPVSFVTEPRTPDEQAVSQMLEAMITAYNHGDIEKHVACYAPDAKIESLSAGGVVSREEYRKAVRALRELPTVELKRTKITMPSPDRSRVEADLHVFSSRGTNIHRIVYDITRREKNWFIIEQQYP